SVESAAEPVVLVAVPAGAIWCADAAFDGREGAEPTMVGSGGSNIPPICSRVGSHRAACVARPLVDDASRIQGGTGGSSPGSGGGSAPPGAGSLAHSLSALSPSPGAV